MLDQSAGSRREARQTLRPLDYLQSSASRGVRREHRIGGCQRRVDFERRAKPVPMAKDWLRHRPESKGVPLYCYLHLGPCERDDRHFWREGDRHLGSERHLGLEETQRRKMGLGAGSLQKQLLTRGKISALSYFLELVHDHSGREDQHGEWDAVHGSVRHRDLWMAAIWLHLALQTCELGVWRVPVLLWWVWNRSSNFLNQPNVPTDQFQKISLINAF